MTTTIAPSLGHGVVATQQGVGTSPGYDAVDLRRLMSTDAVQEGVYAAGDYMVTQRGAGANMSVDIAASSGASALVQGDTVTLQGLYFVGPHSATINEAITAADPTNPRVDQVILEVQDNVHDASGGNLARTRVLTGTATAGATLTNRTGAAALPGNALLLADVLVGAAAGSITNTVIRDRRKWARGGEWSYNKATGDALLPAAVTAVDATATNVRMECSGVPVEVAFNFVYTVAAGGQRNVEGNVLLDGATVIATSRLTLAATVNGTITIRTQILPATISAGSHTFTWRWFDGVGDSTYRSAVATPVSMSMTEIVRQQTANNTTTTG